MDDALTAPLGFNVDVAGPITPALDVFGQFDWSRQSDDFDFLLETWNRSGISRRSGAAFVGAAGPTRASTPFVHGLFGSTHTSFGCEFAGFDCRRFEHWPATSSALPIR